MSASISSFTAGPYWVERVALCMLCFTMTSKTSETHQTTATMAATVRAMSAKIPATKVAVRRATMAVACWLGLKVESTNCIASLLCCDVRAKGCALAQRQTTMQYNRSEERRVGKECRIRWWLES